MRPTLTTLEPRDCPAVDLGGGALQFAGGVRVQPFADWSGSLNTLDVGGLLYVAPGIGGGPRVAVLHADGSRDRPDFFAADPSSREGVVFVAADPPPAPEVPTAPAAPADWLPRITDGDTSDSSTWTIYLDFERPFAADEVSRATAAFWRVYQPLGNVAVTTVRPDDYPGHYGTVVIGAPLSFDPRHPAGVAPARWDEAPSDPYQSRVVYVNDFPWQPENVGILAAHEAGHALGLDHNSTPHTVMSFGDLAPDESFTPDDLVAARMGAARALGGRA